YGVAVDNVFNVYVADTFSNTIRKITSGGDVTTVGGLPGSPGTADGAGAGARFNQPFALAVDGSGNLYIADTRNHTSRRGASPGAPLFPPHPTNGAGAPGERVTSTASATGVPTPGYQWQRQPANNPGFFINLVNDTVFSGVNTSTLTILNVTQDMNND